MYRKKLGCRLTQFFRWTKRDSHQQAKREAHISDYQAKRWQELAALPHGDFEGRLHDPLVTPTTSGVEKSKGGRGAGKNSAHDAPSFLMAKRDARTFSSFMPAAETKTRKDASFHANLVESFGASFGNEHRNGEESET